MRAMSRESNKVLRSRTTVIKPSISRMAYNCTAQVFRPTIKSMNTSRKMDKEMVQSALMSAEQFIGQAFRHWRHSQCHAWAECSTGLFHCLSTKRKRLTFLIAMAQSSGIFSTFADIKSFPCQVASGISIYCIQNQNSTTFPLWPLLLSKRCSCRNLQMPPMSI